MDKNLLRILMVVSLATMGGYSFADTSSNTTPSTAYLRYNHDGSQTMLGHVPRDVASAKVHHHANANEQLDLRIVVPLPNQAELDGLLKGIYDPTSPNYHHFLTTEQFNQEFKASDMDLNKVKSYFSSQGFSINTQSSNGTILHVTGPVKSVEKAFGVHINYYTKKDGTMFRAPDADPTITTEIVGSVSAVAGLDNLSPFKPHSHQLAPRAPAQALVVNGQAASPQVTGTGPGGYLAPADVLKAYDLNTIPVINDPSSLQNVALFELDGYLQSDVATYEAHFHLPNNNSVMLQNVPIDGFNGLPTSTGGSDEVTLDIEELIGIASASFNKIYVYEAANTWQGWMDEWTKMANDNTAKVISCSWGMAEYDSPAIALNFDRAIFQQMAAQGQEVFVASGDCGAYADCSTKTVVTDEPASQAFVTGVGISALSINSDGTYKSEAASLYGGGGISMAKYVVNGVNVPNSIPSYQQAMASQALKASLVSSTMRNVPDVSLTADPSTAYAFYITDPQSGAGWYGFWGSSIAAPTWAAFMAQVNQGRVHSGQVTVGFLNPVIYSMAANSSQYTADFHDIVTGNNQYYPAQTGFDDASGLGSFNGAYLYNDLVSPSKVLTPVPAEPTGLSALPGNNQVTFSWNSSTGATSYNVRRSTVSEGPWTVLKSGATGTNYVDLTAQNGMTYYYTVSAVNAGGESLYVNQFMVTLSPSAPTSLSAVPGNNQVALSWTASTGAVSYNVKRAPTSGGSYTTISTSGSVTVSNYTDKTALNGNAYYYVVSAVNTGGEGANSSQVKSAPVALVPPVPTSLTAVGGNTQVTLSWNASSGATSYNVQRSTTSNASFTTITNITGTRFTDTSLSNGYIYYYEINAVNASGQSANTSEVYAIPAGLPVAPTKVTAVAGNAQATVTFSGASANGSVISGYTVTSSPGAKIVTGTASPITVSGLSNGTPYTFTVSVTNGVGIGAASAPSNSVTPLSPAPPAPTGLQGAGGNNQVTLSWNASSGATSYIVEKATALNGPFSVLASGLTSTGYVDKSVSNGTSYFYIVTAYNVSGGVSANSNEIMVVPLAPLVPPTGLTAVSGPGKVSLSWTAVPGVEFYYLGRSTVNGGPYSIIASPVSNGYTDSSVVSGNTYYYVVEAYVMVNGTGEMSPYSAQVKAVPTAPVPAAPTGLWTVNGNGQVTLYWSASTGATSYNVKRSTLSGSSYTTISASGTVTGASYVDKTAVNGTFYFYVVSAVNASGESANSAQVSAQPVAPLPPPPAAPAGLSAAPGAAQVALAWKASNGATSYNVLRLSDWNVGFVTLATGVTGTQYIDKASLSNGTTYYYEVIAVNAGGKSAPSNQVAIVATLTGNYNFSFYISGSGITQYSYISANGQKTTGTVSPSASISVPAGAQVTVTSTPAAGNKFYQYYVPFNNINYTTSNTVTFNVSGNNYMGVIFQQAGR